MWLGLHIKVNMYTKFQVDPLKEIKDVEVCPDRQTDRQTETYIPHQTSFVGDIKKILF